MANSYGLLADLVVIVHMGFVLFVVLGGVSVLWWPRLAWMHLPAVLWGIGIEWRGAGCPLTPLETWLRTQTGGTGYSGDFIQQYLFPILYPVDLTREAQVTLGAIVLGVNIGVYGWLWRRWRSEPVG